jgi:hypothetical protein
MANETISDSGGSVASRNLQIIGHVLKCSIYFRNGRLVLTVLNYIDVLMGLSQAII